MAVNFLSLPQFQAPTLPNVGNALNSLGQSVETYGNALERKQERTDRMEERQYQRGRAAKSDARAEVEMWGKRALAVDQMPDGPQRQKMWQFMIEKHGADGLTPEEIDPITGPKLMAIQAGQWRDQADGKTYEVDGRLVQVNPGGGVKEIYRSPEKPDPVREMLLQRLQPKQGQAPAPAAPMLQPQSYQGPAPQSNQNPFLQLATDRITPVDDRQQAPQGQPQPQVETTAPNMIDTPFGPMTREDAQQMGGAMLLDPRYAAAGKAMLESLQYGKNQLSKPAETQLDERTISAASGLGRMQNIRKLYRPEFQEIPTKLKLLGASWGAALGPQLGGKLSPELQKQLGDFAAYKATAFDNFNQLLKELSGTAVSAQELSRQKIVQPNPGEGIFDGDDPITFQAKIDQGEKVFRSAIARMNFMRNRGVTFNKDTAEQFLRLEDVPAAIDRRGAEIEQQLRQQNPQADPMSIEREALKRVQQEFGI